MPKCSRKSPRRRMRVLPHKKSAVFFTFSAETGPPRVCYACLEPPSKSLGNPPCYFQAKPYSPQGSEEKPKQLRRHAHARILAGTVIVSGAVFRGAFRAIKTGNGTRCRFCMARGREELGVRERRKEDDSFPPSRATFIYGGVLVS